MRNERVGEQSWLTYMHRCNVLVMITVAIMTWWFKKKNAQADRGECILLEDPNFRFTI